MENIENVEDITLQDPEQLDVASGEETHEESVDVPADQPTEDTPEEVEEPVNLVEKVDQYMDYVVQEWLTENEVAIETGIRNEMTEHFIVGLKNLFQENYIDIPEEKVDVVAELAARVEQLEHELNEERSHSIEIKNALEESLSAEVVSEVSSDLVDVDAEKLKKLSESITFSDPDDFKAKIEVLKESHFPKRTGVLSGMDQESDEPIQQLTETMSVYTNTLDRMLTS